VGPTIPNPRNPRNPRQEILLPPAFPKPILDRSAINSLLSKIGFDGALNGLRIGYSMRNRCPSWNQPPFPLRVLSQTLSLSKGASLREPPSFSSLASFAPLREHSSLCPPCLRGAYSPRRPGILDRCAMNYKRYPIRVGVLAPGRKDPFPVAAEGRFAQ